MRERPATRERQAGRGAVWVVPSGKTFGFFAVLLAMCYAGASQSNGAAYLLCFLLTSVALVSMAHAWANLQGLRVSVDAISPVFAGEEVVVPLLIAAENGRHRFGLRVKSGKGSPPATESSIEPDGEARVEVRFRGERRGHFQRLEIEISSEYPLGFFVARQICVLPVDYFIYPAPAGSMTPPQTLSPVRKSLEGVRHEGDDFGGTRLWRSGESQRHIDWKAAARSPILLTKQWTGEADKIVHLDWTMLAGMDDEARLSQLARWVVAAERQSASYELRLPGNLIAAARGESHYHECLRTLADYSPAKMGS